MGNITDWGHCFVYITEAPGSSTTPYTGSSTVSGSSTDPNLQSPLDLGLVAGVVGTMVVLVLVVAIGIVVLVIWWRYVCVG